MQELVGKAETFLAQASVDVASSSLRDALGLGDPKISKSATAECEGLVKRAKHHNG